MASLLQVQVSSCAPTLFTDKDAGGVEARGQARVGRASPGRWHHWTAGAGIRGKRWPAALSSLKGGAAMEGERCSPRLEVLAYKGSGGRRCYLPSRALQPWKERGAPRFFQVMAVVFATLGRGCFILDLCLLRRGGLYCNVLRPTPIPLSSDGSGAAGGWRSRIFSSAGVCAATR